MLQAAVSLLNIAAHRLGPPADAQGAAEAPPGSAPERDMEQVRDGIDAVRALLEILERRNPGEVRPLRDALARLQMAYAREAQAGGPAAASPGRRRRRPRTRRRVRPSRHLRARARGRTRTSSRGRPRRAAGYGCQAAEAPAGGPANGASSRFRGRHDRLRARLCRTSADAQRAGQQMCARTSSRGTLTRPRRIFC